jgi:hypothetical protein
MIPGKCRRSSRIVEAQATAIGVLPEFVQAVKDNRERFSLTGAAPTLGASRVKLVRRAAKRKTLSIIMRKGGRARPGQGGSGGLVLCQRRG